MSENWRKGAQMNFDAFNYMEEKILESANLNSPFPVPLDLRDLNPSIYTKKFIVLSTFAYNDPRFGLIVIPPGFQTDLASVPALTSWIFPGTSQYDRGGVVHDYLYWDHGFTFLDSNRILEHAVKDCGVSSWRAKTMFFAVQGFGESAWKEDSSVCADFRFRRARATGLWKRGIRERIVE